MLDSSAWLITHTCLQTTYYSARESSLNVCKVDIFTITHPKIVWYFPKLVEIIINIQGIIKSIFIIFGQFSIFFIFDILRHSIHNFVSENRCPFKMADCLQVRGLYIRTVRFTCKSYDSTQVLSMNYRNKLMIFAYFTDNFALIMLMFTDHMAILIGYTL